MQAPKLNNNGSCGQSELTFAAVAIGRNEGERLQRCLESLSAATRVVYVDSGSADGSVHRAREQQIDVIELDDTVPYTAARARNAGFRRLREMTPDLTYVQFIDGDCELNRQWAAEAINYLNAHPEIAAVCGRRRERFPERSIYNWLCDIEWNSPLGEASSFAGDVMIRAEALQGVGGYQDGLIAGEEPELCVRLRAAGWRIRRLPYEMTLHDAAMMRFGQWWRRAVRAGYAFGQGAHLHGASPERHWVWESRRAWLWGLWLPLGCLTATMTLPLWGWATWAVYPLQILRQIVRNPGAPRDRAALAFFQTLARFPEAWGQLKFLWDHLFGAQTSLVEYK
jgi:GT2 family glycosyltransferase